MKTNCKKGLIVSASRRYALLLTEDRNQIWLKLTPGFPKVTVGDRVLYKPSSDQIQLKQRLPRKNCLSRTYRKRSREIAANIDLLLVVSAIPPLFNTDFIDRVLTVASVQEIPCAMVVNKMDLGLESLENLTAIYKRIGLEVVFTSAIQPNGLSSLLQMLNNPKIETVVLAGISGVGKSSILNSLIPEAESVTSEVSRKTGLGRQTTSMSIGYSYQRNGLEDLMIIDLPGIQSFGVTDLSIPEVADSFPEFLKIRHTCEFLDCQHNSETNCAIQEAVENEKISPTRYLSYLNMITEIDEAKEY